MNVADRGGYDPRREHGGLTAEVARLEAQAALGWEAERAILARLLPGPAGRILEVGSGSGAITARLAAAWPDAAIVALEPDADLIDTARRRLAGVTARVRFVEGSIAAHGLGDARFDLVLVRYVLQHLADPVAALRQLAPLLAPEGRIVVIDVDGGLWGAATPDDPALADIHRRAGRTAATGDRAIGRRLWGLLGRAGYADRRIETFCYHSGELGLAAFAEQLSPDRLAGAMAAGDLPFADYLRLLAAHRRFMADPDAFVLMLGFAAHARAG